MTTPPPVDLSKLGGLFNKVKRVMEVTDATAPIVMSESTRKESEMYEKTQPKLDPNAPRLSTSAQPIRYTVEQLEASGLPDFIKESMRKNAIPTPKQEFVPKVKEIINETSGQGLHSNLSESRLKEMIKEVMLEVLTQDYNKNLTETAIKNTLNLLIKEGKINIKK